MNKEPLVTVKISWKKTEEAYVPLSIIEKGDKAIREYIFSLGLDAPSNFEIEYTKPESV